MQKNNLLCPRMKKLQNIIYEGELTRHNSGPAFLDAAGRDGEMFDDKMGHVPMRWKCWGNRESGVTLERF